MTTIEKLLLCASVWEDWYSEYEKEYLHEDRNIIIMYSDLRDAGCPTSSPLSWLTIEDFHNVDQGNWTQEPPLGSKSDETKGEGFLEFGIGLEFC